ncbi:ATP-dependent Clp protease adaptor ClpS [Rhodohalobacter sulfatireducens]|jgi:ATP-dependent Clp protease adapter protein ClpS|uniref:ATP-dependent Clp protease adaptor ClpS n=1 Tax=Rhodohalobacter sulfatireducens TaxID=2911366 RepID=A0ABS9K9X4_9BACT|nr:ATP-dependent Clp protease adaptor ClpS [Rhodohalobacter sulfatireducens]MCG2587652.1 ATP-dependent Clp protease adaptor ClpS [Rhodohalobacter sulfatireducens]MDR9366122.1 ATP-dependent Clp protease adaptor ClpS [Balneolaceae bacterium]MDR9410990.1 ATP-dependent Clp protease adaptor ClpS [Balneolaceae bacterium]NBC03220.1 ATP-dependent Clp protease adaptor ClpS [Bacteroidota bacterium]
MRTGAINKFLEVRSEVKPEKEPDTEVLEKEKEQEDEALDKPWRLILYDDDIHTFDEVINQLVKALGCSKAKAEELTFKVHNEGKATVFEGTFEECLKRNSVLQEIQLVTEIKG